jgi:hypothetical protein
LKINNSLNKNISDNFGVVRDSGGAMAAATGREMVK